MTFNPATNTVKKTCNFVVITLLCLVLILCIPSTFAAAGSNDASGGVITNIEIRSYSQTGYWQGYYGLITSGTSPTHFNYFNNSGANIGTIRKLELGASVQEGDVILITSSSNAPVISELQRGNVSLIDAITGTGKDSGTNTFTNTSDYTMPCTGNNITNVPTAYTFVDGQSQYQNFKEGVLKDRNGNLVFVVPVSSASKQGYDNVSYYFQFMLPNNNTNLNNYYMYYVPSCSAGPLQVNIISPENKTYVKINGSSGGTDSTPIPITVSANRTISVYNYSLDGGAQKSFVNGTTTINPGFGSHKITVYLKDTNGISGTDTQYFKVSNPVINSCYPDRYFAISNSSNVSFRLNATGDLNKTLYINVTVPNGSVSTFNLSNVSDVFYYTPDSEGRYNVTFNANYSECSSYFWSLKNLLPMTIKVLEINESNGIDGIQARARWYWPGTNDVINPVDYTEDFTGETTFNYTNVTDESTIFPDVEFSQYNTSLVVRLNRLNLSTATNEFYHDLVESPPENFLLTYGIHTTKEFTNANLSINYSNTAYSNEDKLSLWKCDNWDYVNATCLSSWVQRSDANQNKVGNLFNITVTNFSGFSIREIVATSGGGGGGGGNTPTPTPSASSTPAPTPIPTSTPAVTPSTVYIPGTGVTIEGGEGNTLSQWVVALLGFMLPASEEEYLEKCEGCNLWGLNYSWWIVCWYWWVLLITILGLRMMYMSYMMVYLSKFVLLNTQSIGSSVNFALKIRDNKDPLSLHLKEILPDNIVEKLDNFDENKDNPEAIIKPFIDGINKILKGELLYTVERFVQVTLKEDTEKLMLNNLGGTKLILLNRLLLDDAYPYEIVSVRENLGKEWKEKLIEMLKSKMSIPAIIILMIPFTAFVGLIAYPLNWVIGSVGIMAYMIFLKYKQN